MSVPRISGNYAIITLNFNVGIASVNPRFTDRLLLKSFVTGTICQLHDCIVNVFNNCKREMEPIQLHNFASYCISSPAQMRRWPNVTCSENINFF